MKLSRKKVIELCIELWTWCMETGEHKEQWPRWKDFSEHIYNDCWFCEYGTWQEDRYHSNKECCEYCPLYSIFKLKGCYHPECAYLKWSKAKTPRTRKKYAKLFLEQIKTLS